LTVPVCTKGGPVKSLTEGKTSKGGRNNTGRIVVRYQGGGHKQRYRLIDFKRNKFNEPAIVERLEYDPNRTAFIRADQVQGRHPDLHPGAAAPDCRRQCGVGRPGGREGWQCHAAGRHAGRHHLSTISR
jgi:hypothetical protein